MQLETAVARWFGRFPATEESREDNYLLDPQLPGLSVKVQAAGGALDVKAYRESPGILEVAGRARGRMECWQKCSCSSPRHGPEVACLDTSRCYSEAGWYQQPGALIARFRP